MTRVIRNAPDHKIILYNEDDGARVETWTPTEGFRSIQFSNGETNAMLEALTASAQENPASQNEVGVIPRMILLDEPVEEREV